MTVVIRPVDIESEREELLDIVTRNLGGLTHARRFEWLYHCHPAGKSWAWFAYEKESGQTVGTASVFPRAMWIADKIEICGQVGDFAVEKGHRSLGPALLLQRATFTPVDEGRLAFCYDCPPHDRGMSTFRRLGMQANTRMKRYARLLRADRVMSKLLKGRAAPAPLLALANYYLRSAGSYKRASGLEISFLEGDFGEEFSSLDEQVGGGRVIRARRRAEDLNWRYRKDPLHHYEVLVAREHGELLAYLVFTLSEHDACLVDLFGLRTESIGRELLHTAVEHARTKSAHSFQAYISEDSQLTGILEKCGLRYREQAERVVAYAPPGSKTRAQLEDSRWFFQQADLMA